MNRDELYQILDIVAPEEFEYYENLAALLEADEVIDVQLILELVKELDMESLADMFDSYFEEWNKSIPDELAEFYVTVDTAKRSIMGNFNDGMTDEDYSNLARYTGETCNYSFDDAYEYTGDSYSVRLSDIIGAEYN